MQLTNRILVNITNARMSALPVSEVQLVLDLVSPQELTIILQVPRQLASNLTSAEMLESVQQVSEPALSQAQLLTRQDPTGKIGPTS
jgi:hypothetical protein